MDNMIIYTSNVIFSIIGLVFLFKVIELEKRIKRLEDEKLQS